MNPFEENGGDGDVTGDDREEPTGASGNGFEDLFEDPADEFEDLIRDPDFDFDDPRFGWEDPSSARRRSGSRSGGARGGSYAGDGTAAADSLARLIELVGGLASEAMPPDTRRQVERMLRDLLIVLRDTIDRLIDRLDEHGLDDEIEIEEIRVD